MDGEGYVPLSVVGRFNRVRALTQDLNLIKEVGMEQTPRGLYFVVIMWHPVIQALLTSDVVELASSGDRIRQRVGWVKWIVAGFGAFKMEMWPTN